MSTAALATSTHLYEVSFGFVCLVADAALNSLLVIILDGRLHVCPSITCNVILVFLTPSTLQPGMSSSVRHLLHLVSHVV